MSTTPGSSNEDRLQFLFMNLVGQLVSVHAVDGSVTEGLFVSRTDDDAVEPSILLSKTRNRRSVVSNADALTEVNELLLIPLSSVVFVNAVGLRVEAAAAGRVGHFRSTALEMNWADLPPEDDRAGVNGVGLEEEEKTWQSGKWDQFEANKKFGVRSTYNENLYTTTLDRSKFSKEQVEAADRMSREIERSSARGGIQHRIERGEEVEEDEGALYSDVQRKDKGPQPAPKSAPYAAVGKKSTAAPPRDTQPPPPIEPQSQQNQSVPTGAAGAAASPNAASGRGLSVAAQPFVPGGSGFASSAAPVVATPTPFKVDDMLTEIGKAMEKQFALDAPMEWDGEDTDDRNGYQQQGGHHFGHTMQSGGSFNPNPNVLHVHHHHQHQHHSLPHHPAHLHHSHHLHNQQHHAHSNQHNSHSNYYSSQSHTSQSYSGQPPSRYVPNATSPVSDPRAGPPQQSSGVARPQGMPLTTAITSNKPSQQQPQQPVPAAPQSSSNSNIAAPLSVSEEPRRAMGSGGAVLSRGARASQNPTRHEDPAPAPQSTASNPPGASLVNKKKGGK